MRRTAEQRKDQIVRAVLDLAGRAGPDRLTTQMIARGVGVTQPAIFRHFPTKQDLWTEVAGHIAGRMEERWRRTLSRGGEPLDVLRALIAVQLDLLQTRPAVLAIIFSHELQYENPDLKEIFRKLMMAFHGHIAGLVAAARGAKRGMEEADAAFVLIALVQGLALRWSLSGHTFDLVEEGRRLLDLQIVGLGLGAPAKGAGKQGTAE